MYQTEHSLKATTMIDTSRIRSGFDVEMLIGGRWFLTALQAMHERGILFPDGAPPPFQPDAEITLTDAFILTEGEWDLQVDLTIAVFPVSVLARLSMNDVGDELIITTNLPDVGITVPFAVLNGLAGVPVLRKLPGDGNEIDPAIAFLANLDLRSTVQALDPLPAGEHEARGNTPLAQSFLRRWKDIAVGIGATTFPRFANDVWHSQLRDEDGAHPFPDAETRRGDLLFASMAPQTGRIRMTLVGIIPLDSPLIDVIPDARVTLTVDLIPSIVAGNLVFAIEVDTDIDTGLLGDLFAAIVGGLIGFIIGAFLGQPLAGAAIGAAGGVIILEVGEAIVEGRVNREIRATPEGPRPPQPFWPCRAGIVQETTRVQEDSGLALGLLDALPRSIPIFTDLPDSLHRRSILVNQVYDDLTLNNFGLAFCGMTTRGERFQPLPASLIGRFRNGDSLQMLRYTGAEGVEALLSLEDVLLRMQDAEIRTPFRLRQPQVESTFRIPEGRLPTVCLEPVAIRRKDTIVTEIQFSTGLDLTVSETVALQEAGALIVRGYQLIHPKNANSYYRALADDTTENNFESLPLF